MVVPFQLVADTVNTVANSLIQPIFLQILTLGFGALPLVITFWNINDQTRDENSLNNPTGSETYDFIVVGAGCAGGVVANRLSRYYNVLLLNVGGEVNPIQFVPNFAQPVLRYPELDFAHRTLPQKYNDGVVNKQVDISVGRILGGSASLNFMIYLRGHAKDYENWANKTGDPSWSWEGVLPFFKSFENYEIPGDHVNHGYNGELRIEAPDYIGTAPEFVAAAKELGYPNVDLNAPYREGFDVIRYPIRRGIRQATYKAFIEPARIRKRLTIRKFSQVNKILLKPGNIAYGVVYDRHGKTYSAYASKEVIITAGSIGTAKLLMLSGIGPRSHLESLNIPVNADLPVGMNLKDHPTTYLAPFYLREPRGLNPDRDITISEFIKWGLFGRGRLTTTAAEATGFIVSKYARARGEETWPDVQYMHTCAAVTAATVPIIANALGFKFDEVYKYFEPGFGQDACLLGVIGARPRSKGYVKLSGNSPYDDPIIQPNYFVDEVDLLTVVEGIKVGMTLLENTTAFGRNLGARFTDFILPGCKGIPFRTDAYWECYAKRWTLSIHHPSGTAAMGQVVDTQLRVFGVSGLRVLDQSVAPELVAANTMSSTLMIAEKGSHMILEYWKNVPPSNHN